MLHHATVEEALKIDTEMGDDTTEDALKNDTEMGDATADAGNLV